MSQSLITQVPMSAQAPLSAHSPISAQAPMSEQMQDSKDPQWYYKAYWRDLSDDYLAMVEGKCKNSEFSNCCMIGPNESLREILEKDEMTLAKLNITRQQIADVLESVHVAWQYSKDFEMDHTVLYPEKFIKNRKYLVQEIVYLGSQYSPFQHPNDTNYYGYKSGDRNISIIRMSDQKRFDFGHLLIHMIRYNGFFEGQTNMTQSCYHGISGFRIDPEEVIDFFGIQENVDYSITWKPSKIWQERTSQNFGIETVKPFMDKYALRKWTHFDSNGLLCLSIYLSWNKKDISSVISSELLTKEYDTHELIELYVNSDMSKRRVSSWNKEFKMTEEEFQQHLETVKKDLHKSVDLYLNSNTANSNTANSQKSVQLFDLCILYHEDITKFEIPEFLKTIDGYKFPDYKYKKGSVVRLKPVTTSVMESIVDF